jgi:cob(I)alamin adenosyltransferase
MKINELDKREKKAMIQARMNNYQRKYYELYLDLIAQEAIKGKEQHIKMTKDRIEALTISYDSMEKELQKLEGEKDGI